MNNQHPITPPPDLAEEWSEEFKHEHPIYFATRAAQWGADQELEAVLDPCKKWLTPWEISNIRAIRRPKPLSLKKQALFILDDAITNLDAAHKNILRRALEQLDD